MLDMCSPPCRCRTSSGSVAGDARGTLAGVRCAGVLLTGGASTRMGRDKASITVGGDTLAGRTGRLLRRVADPCVEVGPGVSGLPAVREDPPGAGPLVAVSAGWDALGDGAFSGALVVAADLPFVSERLL